MYLPSVPFVFISKEPENVVTGPQLSYAHSVKFLSKYP